MPRHPGLTLRPYQILCAICTLGDATPPCGLRKIRRLLAAVGKSPDLPLTLTCNVGEVFAYQDPGTAADTPEGAAYNVKRDLEILHKLNLAPGSTLPARILFSRALDRIEDVSAICSCGTAPVSEAWKGCPLAHSGCYARGRAKDIAAIIPPRCAQDMEHDKAESIEAMHKAPTKKVRPHILLCSVCQYGGGTRPPFPDDNLPELLALILREPDTLIELVAHADWMMCAPCPSRAPELNACVNNRGSGGMPNHLRDLRVMQKLGLTYGSVVKARELYGLIFSRLSGTLEICGYEVARPSVWWTGCGSATSNSENFEKGRRALMEALRLGEV